MEAVAPDLVTAVIGFRQWRLHGSELWSLHATDRWHRGVQTAHCDDGTHAGPAPANGCTCGMYAWYGPPPRGASAATSDLVAGAVALWGQIELHAHGMRAQHATIVAIALPFSWGDKRRRILAAAEALEVPAVPARRLKAAGLRHGELIPRRMRPARHDAEQAQGARRAGSGCASCRRRRLPGTIAAQEGSPGLSFRSGDSSR